MARQKNASNRKDREAASLLGAVGVLSLAGSASAATTGPVIDTPARDTAPRHEVAISEVADVSLATFYVFDKENSGTSKLGGEKLAWWRRCWGCRGCRGHWSCGCRC
jgi:hypothetical protein